EFAQRSDGRWVDLQRPRAVPMGFETRAHAEADRRYHLRAVARLLKELDVLTFTLGLTEAWENAEHGYVYPVVPGVIAGEYLPGRHRFVNDGVAQITEDLRRATSIIRAANPNARVLLTVSPVSLVATAEPRHVIVSSAASKAILRAAADEAVRDDALTDYFPSYEIITGPYARGRYWAEGLREVTQAGVEVVMDAFIRSRLPGLAPGTVAARPVADGIEARLDALAEAECDEQFLDPALRKP
ncbi:MAG TPA: GSCFA domain-containing protein, partial [Burkholderiales bacterium]|nr:GSCFA domain-containing protein [Burkholderiales bacterium]